ncbi:hypothetical protein LF65_03872 [Clostridium beijerinckii]|uniref:Uncharacterized protein n=1 Tax=Clostridium beijerinckii TaxID=1520 RepID=A0A0B5QU57_CLOBE|nr:hypothetical protein [Clostridium beijerinckii]AJH00424.1 hypothetical protein LF65_03872 [Clostridium beijerinckii]
MATKNIEIQDSTGNIYYPHTDASIVKFGDSNVNATLSDIVKNISNDVILTPSMNYGMNNKITNTGEVTNSPKFTIQGKTVINLLGKDGNCEDTSKWWPYQANLSNDSINKVFGNNGIKITLTSTTGCLDNLLSKYNIDITKYYLISAYLKNGNATNIVLNKDAQGGGVSINSATVTSTTNFTRVGLLVKPSDLANGNYFQALVTGASGQYAYVDGIMLNEITASEYALGVNALLANYPYVDCYTCLQNPYIEVRHDNLIRNGNCEEGTSWWSNVDGGNADSASTLSILNGKLAITQTNSASHWYTQKIKVKPNTNYYLMATLSDSTNSFINVTDPLNSVSLFVNNNGTFNTNSYDEIGINIQTKGSSLPSTYYFSSIMLIEGTTAPSNYKPCRVERTVLETKLTSDDSIAYKNGEVTGQIWWKHKTLFGKDYDWQYYADGAGGKCIIIPRSSLPGLQFRNSSDIFVKHDGTILSAKTNFVLDAYDAGNYFFYNPKDTDTGWTETINPNNDEVKAFMNGWFATYNNGSRYVSWTSIVDNSMPPITIYSKATAASTGVSITVDDATKFIVNDVIAVMRNGIRVAGGTIQSISGNVINIAYSVTVAANDLICRCDAGGANRTDLINYCKNNVAPGYEGYQLHYKLQTPESINDNNCVIHGDIPLFDVGDNYLYLDSGMVLGEIANPKLGDSGVYRINSTWQADSRLKYRTERILSAYKNSLYDNSWYLNMSTDVGYTYGMSYLTSTNFESLAIYTVDYKILATQAPQIGTISCSYSQDINSTISNIHESLNNKQVHDSILDQIVDKSLYEVSSVGDVGKCSQFFPWVITATGTSGYVNLTFNIGYKKAKPTITISFLQILCADTDVTSKFQIAGFSINPNQVVVQMVTRDATMIANLKTCGLYGFGTIVADCRGRI